MGTVKFDFDNEESTFSRRIQINGPVDYAGLIDKIKLNLSAAIDHYWKDLSDSKFILYSLLDSRIKKLSFISDEKSNAARIIV